MKKYKLIIIYISLLVFITPLFSQKSQNIKGPGYYELKEPNDSIIIPFEFFKSDLLVKPTINGVKTKMLVDNGVLWDQLFFFGSSILDSLKFEYTGKIRVGGEGNGKPILNDYTENAKVDFGNICFYEQDAIVSPPELGLQKLWNGVDGQISAMFFKHFITEINYDRKVLILHQPASFRPNKAYTRIPMIRTATSEFSISVEIVLMDGTKINTLAQIDLGASNHFLFYYADKQGLNIPTNLSPEILGYGVQGELYGHRIKIKEFRIGAMSIKGIKGQFVKNNIPDQAYKVILGFKILSRFNTILDYHNSVLYIKPIKDMVSINNLKVKNDNSDKLSWSESLK